MASRPSFTLGIEEEFQAIDPETRQLKSHIAQLFIEGQSRIGEHIKRELHTPIIEITSPICTSIADARAEMRRLRREIIAIAESNGLRIGAAGTHPITRWQDVPISEGAHYERLVYELQLVARANLVFGLHVHVAVEDDEARVAIANGARYFLPHIFALSVNSPFWSGHPTGFKSFRAKVFERFPRTGIPGPFNSFGEWEDFVQTLVVTNTIRDAKSIWYDVRIHPHLPTLEYRICDIPMRLDETICLAAIFQAVTVKLWKLYDQNQGWRTYRAALIAENKQRAARYGLDGKLIDLGKRREIDAEPLLHELAAFLDDTVDELGSRGEVEYLFTILRERTGADRQLAVYEQTRSLPDVVDYIIAETKRGL
ncbi:MAG: carboxylate-amine ligase [Candidatus Eremiobacteraeota bacterium]|nr:carboxylate-amine ligase [Candidatus Eremiobacteraeota bacterium]